MQRKDFQLLDVTDDGFLSLMDNSANIRKVLKVPEGDIKKDITENRDIVCTVLSACGKEAVIATKVNTKSKFGN